MSSLHLNFSTVNTLWSSILVETLSRLGSTTAILCPGSRSTPLTVAFTQHPQIDSISSLDERSAAFLALGLAKRHRRPVPLVCTSGTAGANFYPALIEAHTSRIPMLVLTADRPPELRDCHSGQTIDQIKLYGSYTNAYAELSLPSTDPDHLAYLRQHLIHAWTLTLSPVPGPVHLNQPFRDPLAPIPDGQTAQLEATFPSDFFSHIEPPSLPRQSSSGSLPFEIWQACDRGLIIAGPAEPQDPSTYCHAVAHLSRCLGWPVIAEGLSPVRHFAYLNPHLITTYDLWILDSSAQDPNTQDLLPDCVIQLGPLPTSKALRQWLASGSIQKWVIDPSDRNLDPLHQQTRHYSLSVEQLAAQCPDTQKPSSDYLHQWIRWEQQANESRQTQMQRIEPFFEGKIAWILSQHLAVGSAVMVANSRPVRDVEAFWAPTCSQFQIYFNRGANGIDGTLSTALGLAYGQAAVLLTGDLALLHDTNGFLFTPRFRGHLTIVLINNNGGGIFEMLPIAQFDPPFEAYFATPQSVEFGSLCQAYGVEYHLVQSWDQLIGYLDPLPTTGIRVLEVRTDRKADQRVRATWDPLA